MSSKQGEYFFLPQEHILFGVGSLARLPEEVKRLGGERILLVTGQSLATKTDIVERTVATLGTLHAGTFSAIRQHTPASDVAAAVEQVRQLKADLIVSLGGGSPIDATKAIVHALRPELGKILPHIAIPTTLSAAEFSHLAGVTDDATSVKGGVGDPTITPTAVLLDASL